MLTCMLLFTFVPHVSAPVPTVEGHHGLAQYHRLRALVMQSNACSLPGVTIKYENFMSAMWNAVHKGYVMHEDAMFVGEGLRYGFKAGIDVAKMTGHRWFRNYPSALDSDAVIPLSTAIQKRVDAFRTVDLGVASSALLSTVRRTFECSAIFPMGCVDKSVEYMDEAEKIKAKRPTDDHTRTGLNAATDMSALRHTLDAYADIAWFLRQDYFMRVSDVEAAFPMLPFHPDVWRFMFFRYVPLEFATDKERSDHLYMHVTGDFGTAGMPGVFHTFFVKVVVPMARCAQVLTLPMAIYVDDLGLIGESQSQVDAEMLAFHQWAWEVCGVVFKSIKDRVAARHQLMIGFWWDSRTLTRSLDEIKVFSYMDTMLEFASRKTITLREMQSAAGKMQRVAMTLPPGAACLIVSLFTLMAGLRLPWHRRRVNKQARVDILWMRFLLSLNMGKGYFSLSNFGRAPEVRSDASKSRRLTAGGYVSRCGMYNWWKYGANAARRAIDYLEGDSALQTWREMGPSWFKKVVAHGIDNMSFEKSVEKGRSKVERLNCLLREAFAIQVAGTFVVDVYWISTHDNVEPDLLSRDQEEEFLRRVYETGFWAPGTVPIRHGSAGQVRVLPESRGQLSVGAFHISNEQVEARSRHATSVHLGNKAQPVARADFPMAQRGSLLALLLLPFLQGVAAAPSGSGRALPLAQRGAGRARLTSGLPSEFLEMFETVMANRYSSSSWDTINSGTRRWRVFADEWDLPVIIPTDHDYRGGWMVAWVLSMAQDTDLVFKSIQGYVWGMRVWQTLQHQADPLDGLMNWEHFMAGIKVLTHVPSEPRKEMPLWVLERIVDETDWDDLLSASLTFLLLLLAVTFSRAECPLPRSKSGRRAFDPDAHWRTCDMDLREYAGRLCLWIRFQRIKQDQRVERPEAAGDGDWSILGPIPGSKFCPVQASIKFNKVRGPHEPNDPLFCDPAKPSEAWIYDQALHVYHGRQDDFGIPRKDHSGLHGGRIRGYNGTKQGLGEDIAVAHGRWKSRAHERYDRFRAEQVVLIPQAVFGLMEHPIPSLDPSERVSGPPRSRISRHELRVDPPESDSEGEEAAAPADEPDPIALLPPGWWEEVRGEGRRYLVCFGPDGERTKSRAQAWRAYEQSRARSPGVQREEDVASEVASPGGLQQVSVRPPAVLNTHVRFDEDGLAIQRPPSPLDSVGRARPRAQPRLARPREAEAATSSSRFPDDLEQHVVEFDRASSRPPPRSRN